MTVDSYGAIATVASFVAPFALGARFEASRSGRQRAVAGFAAAAVGAAFLWCTLASERFFPYVRNCITQFGFFSPNELLVGDLERVWPAGTDRVLSVVFALVAVRIVYWIVSSQIVSARLRLVALLGALQFTYLLATSGIAFDRHMLVLLPTVLVLLAATARQSAGLRLAAFMPAIAVFLLYSVAVTHDWNAISRMTTEAADSLESDGIDAEWIDAGYAQTGYRTYERSRREIAVGAPVRARLGDAWYVRTLYRRVESRYVISLSPRLDTAGWMPAVSPWTRPVSAMPRLDSYVPYSEHSFATFWPPGTRNLWVLRDTRLTTEKPGR